MGGGYHIYIYIYIRIYIYIYIYVGNIGPSLDRRASGAEDSQCRRTSFPVLSRPESAKSPQLPHAPATGA